MLCKSLFYLATLKVEFNFSLQRIFFVDHGLYPLEKGEKVWNNKKFDGYSISAFVEDKKKRYKSLVSWEDEQPFNIYEFLLAKDIDMEM